MALFIAGVASTFVLSVIGIAVLALRAPVLDASAFAPKQASRTRPRPV